VIAPEQVWILFPNTQVKKGLRAGLILTELRPWLFVSIY